MILDYKCPCGENYTLSEERCYEICPICHWEDDPVQFEDPNFKGGANILSLNESRKVFLIKIGLITIGVYKYQ